MSLLKKLLLGAAVLVFIVLAGAFLLPRTAHVERSIVIDSPPATVFTLLNGFRQFRRWSPWQDADPDMSVRFEGPPTGVGAALSWSGNSAVGTGRQEILESEPYRRILLRLQFGDVDGDFRSTFTLEPERASTRVTWGFDADYGNSVLGRYFGLLSDAMVGPDYEKGLARLRSLAESLPPEDFSTLDLRSVQAEPQPFVFVSGRSAVEARSLGVALGVAYGRVSGYLASVDADPSGAAVAVFHREQDGLVYFDAGLTVDATDVPVAGEIRLGMTPAGPAIRAVWEGTYAGLPEAHRKLEAYLAAAGLERAGPSWEIYPGGPEAAADPNRQTEIYVGVK